jgi:ubiquinone/menaquinone biosynthesis C-methylase UbiE
MKNEDRWSFNNDLGYNGNNSVWIRHGGLEEAAQIYEDNLVPAMFAPFATDLIRSSIPKSSDNILDVACGTGILSRHAIDYINSNSATMRRVVGIDISPTMLKIAQHSSREKDIEWVEGSAASLPFPDESFSLAMCQQGLQFFPDKLRSLKEINRVLVGDESGGGRLALSIWTSIKDSPSFDILEQLLQQIFGHEAAAIMRMPYSLSDPLEVLSLVKSAGFNEVEMREVTKTVSFASNEEFIYSFTRGSMLASYFSKVNESEYEKLLSYGKQKLLASGFVREGISDGKKLSFPLKSRLVFARKH